MGRTIRGVAATVVVVVAVTGCSTAGTATVNTDYAHAAAAGTRTIKAKASHGAEQVIASPDGQKLFYVDGGRPCLWTIADRSQVCAPKDVQVRAGRHSGQWSPDSKAVAFTDDYLETFQEPDIWVMQADDGSVRDITNDHIEGGVMGAKEALIDLQPTWLDARTIVFARQHGRKASRADVSSIAAQGGAVTTLFHLKKPIQYINGMAVSPDGTTVAYSVADRHFRSATVHLRSLDGTGADSPVPAEYDASMLSFSADGAYLLADSRIPYAQYGRAQPTGAMVVKLADRTTVPVTKDDAPWYPTWSPTGHALAFLTGRNAGDSALKFVAHPGGEARKLAGGKDFPLVWEILRWSPSSIVMRTPDGFTTVTVTTS